MIETRNVIDNLLDGAIEILVKNNDISEKDFKDIAVKFGYLLRMPDNNVEALFKITVRDLTHYFSYQKKNLMLIGIPDEMFDSISKEMTEKYPECNMFDRKPSQELIDRRNKNIEILKKDNIVFIENLSHGFEEKNVKIKDLDTIVKKAISTLLVVQVACDINYERDYEEAVKVTNNIFKRYNITLDDLNDKEKRIMDGTYTKQDAIDMDWAYEIYWSICWYLGLVDDIKNGGECCDCNEAIRLVLSSKNEIEFKEKCKVRSTSELLDMLDLYHLYNWALVENQINESANIGNLDYSNVLERRRGLEWLISSEFDWYNIKMSA
mgnify:CR=1 FL=1